MATVARSILVVAVTLLLSVEAGAQVPVAPAPHPTLDELVKLYQHLGLRLPPPEAPLSLLVLAQAGTGENVHAYDPLPRSRPPTC